VFDTQTFDAGGPGVSEARARFSLVDSGHDHFFWRSVRCIGAVQMATARGAVPIYFALTIIYVIYVLRASFRAQRFQNERVGKALHEQTI
jgi:hypothetical protein